MKVVLVYNFPVDLRERYTPFAKQWIQTLHKFPPNYPVDFVIGFSGGDPQAEDTSIFTSLGNEAMHIYHGQGCDIGTYLSFARSAEAAQYDFIICCGATVYFHRIGAIRRLMEEVEKNGPSLYTASASHEGDPNSLNPPPNPHARTSFFGCDPKVLAAYPFEVTNREECYRFEGRDRKFGLYCKPVRMVTFSGVFSLDDCRKPPNVFRKGSQSDLLVKDGRTDEFDRANPAEKKRLENMADGSCMP